MKTLLLALFVTLALSMFLFVLISSASAKEAAVWVRRRKSGNRD
jgi:hypothetical protein